MAIELDELKKRAAEFNELGMVDEINEPEQRGSSHKKTADELMSSSKVPLSSVSSQGETDDELNELTQRGGFQVQ